MFFTVVSNAQTSGWEWGQQSISAGANRTPYLEDGNPKIATDDSGNVYVAGAISTYSVSIGANIFSGSGIQAVGPVFFAKYNSSGVLQWVQSSNAGSVAGSVSVATDQYGNVYLTGSYGMRLGATPGANSITFGAYTLATSGLDMFLVKLNGSGNVIWAKTIPASQNGLFAPSAITTDPTGNVFVTGNYDSTTTFGSITLANIGANERDGFLVKFDSAGNALWAKGAGNPSGSASTKYYTLPTSIATDASGNAFVSGEFAGPSHSPFTTTIGTTVLNTSTDTLAAAFLAKYDASGNVLWVQASDSAGLDGGVYVATDPSGNANISGYFYATAPAITHKILFGSLGLSAGTTSAYNHQSFLVQYSPSGAVNWATQSDTAASGWQFYATYVATDNSGNVYITGNFTSSVKFGSTTLNSGAYSNLYLVKYSSSGSINWAVSHTSTNVSSYGLLSNLAPREIAADASGNVFVTGNFYPAVLFGTDSLTCSDSMFEIFTAKYASTNGISITSKTSTTLTAYPNPTGGLLNVAIEAGIYSAMVIYNTLGQQVYRKAVSPTATTLQIDLSNMPNGMYYIKATGNDKTDATMIIVNR